jgi:hypothetical protein
MCRIESSHSRSSPSSNRSQPQTHSRRIPSVAPSSDAGPVLDWAGIRRRSWTSRSRLSLFSPLRRAARDRPNYRGMLCAVIVLILVGVRECAYVHCPSQYVTSALCLAAWIAQPTPGGAFEPKTAIKHAVRFVGCVRGNYELAPSADRLQPI